MSFLSDFVIFNFFKFEWFLVIESWKLIQDGGYFGVIVKLQAARVHLNITLVQ